MKFKKILKTIWELPQTLVGLLVVKAFKCKYCGTFKDAYVYGWSLTAGMSLGKHIFIPLAMTRRSDEYVKQYIMHEYGHTIQSKYLGWLYLLAIGLPSLIWANCFEWYRKKTGKSYYAFYTESWADKLGGVNRVQARD